jgi:hypothetical protein
MTEIQCLVKNTFYNGIVKLLQPGLLITPVFTHEKTPTEENRYGFKRETLRELVGRRIPNIIQIEGDDELNRLRVQWWLTAQSSPDLWLRMKAAKTFSSPPGKEICSGGI